MELMLGIETSCDDTSVALVDRAGRVAAIETVSQFEIHAPHGGVYPELASRAHLEAILPATRAALDRAGIAPRDLAGIGVTRGPGLIGSLLVGLSTAQALALAWDTPLYGVNHLRGHIRSVDLEEARLRHPALLLLVSGGHTLLAHLPDPWTVRLMGTTRDDSVGESYDKVARLLGLGMPGGPEIDRRAKAGEAVIRFPRPMIREGYEFSFSGLKSSVARHLETHPDAAINDVAASFVASCLDVLAAKCARAIDEVNPAALAVVGGVAASPQLRARMAGITDAAGVELCLPPLRWSTDNAAMIALAAWDYADRGLRPDLQPKPNLGVETP
ncbi:MAG TPA: tRNA (adenosine(37)-N6)-threonylcarbamoyltransferase complex transferase subunit TsaD [Rhodobacteraceae bacterium]|jgi:N6-L-threonylcarbamoyladenine synthase|nr:tRNA (adenosine(37)-N6)-threonylcarbamoyltransferase complex transferase subunit TsaD [Paracoccaceae bacterium]